MNRAYTMIVKDSAGVLNRITGFIRRNGWNVQRIRVEPLAGSGQSTMYMEMNLNGLEAQRFEQKMHEWNFVFDSHTGGEEAGV